MKVKARKGDSLAYYSHLFMIPLDLLVDSNRLNSDSILEVGQSIQIPGFTLKPFTLGHHDAFWQIAYYYHLSIDALLLVNQRRNPNSMEKGDMIYVPQRLVKPLVHGQTNYDFKRLNSDLEQLVSSYPFVSMETIGYSVLGLPIQELRFGRGDLKIHFNASFHANEWITSPILLQLLNSLLLALTNNQLVRGIDVHQLYNKVDVSVVPMVNPDGVNLVLNGPTEEMDEVISFNNGSLDFTGWKANIRGVDLNNQFPANWEVEKGRKIPKAPAPRDFPGNAPLTEPEAIVMANLAKKRNFDRLLAFHTQGQEFYWGYEGLEPGVSSILANEFERVSGYRSVKYIDSHAGYKDWFIQEFKKAGFTFELGKGINPLPLSQYKRIYDEMLGIFLAVMYV